MSIPLYWWKTRANFGDLLSPIIVSHVSRHKVQYSEKLGKLLALGSILGLAKEGDCVWGSGIRGRPVKTKNIRVFAVRGPKTRDVLHRYDIDCPAVYGDPAWLMPQIYDPNIDKRYKTAVLPHYSDVRLRRFDTERHLTCVSIEQYRTEFAPILPHAELEIGWRRDYLGDIEYFETKSSNKEKKS